MQKSKIKAILTLNNDFVKILNTYSNNYRWTEPNGAGLLKIILGVIKLGQKQIIFIIKKISF